MKLKESIYFVLEIVVAIAIIIGAIFYGFSNKGDDLKSAEKAEKTLIKITEIRVALEKYYKLTGQYPDLARVDVPNNLRILDYEDSKGKKISFADIYGKEKLSPTESTEKIEESNLVYDVSDFKKASFNGGWNFNYSERTGEIHANLPVNSFNQNLDWSEE